MATYHFNEQLGARLRRMRGDHNLTQMDLADMLHIHRPEVSRIESGIRGLTVRELVILHYHAAIPMHQLLKGIQLGFTESPVPKAAHTQRRHKSESAGGRASTKKKPRGQDHEAKADLDERRLDIHAEARMRAMETSIINASLKTGRQQRKDPA